MKENGYFSQNGYVITERSTPRHWYNYLFNNEYIAAISQIGSGGSYVRHNAQDKIPLVADRAVYIVEDNHYWQATGSPVSSPVQHYHCEHGIGFSEICTSHQRIKSKCRFFVATHGKCEYLCVTLKNDSKNTRTLKIIPFFDIKSTHAQLTQAFYVENQNCVFASNIINTNKKPYHAYLTSSDLVTSYDTNRNSFIGIYGSQEHPHALETNFGCSNSECYADKFCLALENTITLQPGEIKTFYYATGIESAIEKIPQLLPTEIESLYEESLQSHKQNIKSLRICTPWDTLDNISNDWLKYQAELVAEWGRIESCHPIDVAKAAKYLSCFNADLAQKHLCRALQEQHSSGYMPHCAETAIEFIFAAHLITKEVGNFTLLLEKIPFSGGETATIYEHIKRGLYYLWSHTGHNGLIRTQLHGDDEIVSTKGVSISASILFIKAAKMLSQIANWMGSESDSRTAAHYALEMQNRVSRYGWNNDRYIEAISDNKHLVGAKECAEGNLYARPQLLSVVAELDKEHYELAMDTLEQELNTDLGLLYCYPPYALNHSQPYETPNYLPGIGRNGGIDLETAIIKLNADCLLQRNVKIEEGLRKILPSYNEFVVKFGEPYTLYDYYTSQEAGNNAGQPALGWHTLSGPQFLHTLICSIFGLQADFGGLMIRPCLPPSWKDCSISKEFRNCQYNIHYVQKDNGVCNTIESIYVNGSEVNRQLPIKPQPGKKLNIEVILKA